MLSCGDRRDGPDWRAGRSGRGRCWPSDLRCFALQTAAAWPRAGLCGVPDAIDVLKPSGVLAIAGTAPSFDFFESNGGWELKPEHFRIHALATQRAAEEIGRAVGWPERDELADGGARP